MSKPTADMSSTQPIRLAIEQFDNSGWTGGVGYLQNVLRALASLDKNSRPQTILCRRPGHQVYSAAADQFLEFPPDPRVSRAARIYRRLAGKVGVDHPTSPAITAAIQREKVDAFFTHNLYSPSIGVPLIGWIPDFQHIHLPQIAGADHARQVTAYHRDLVKQSKVLLVSSNDVLKDLRAFSPGTNAHVVQFVAWIPEDIYAADCGAICGKYSLPERYFFLPNQFWKHKNHLLVIEALSILKARGVDATVVCTGTTFDGRDPEFFSSVLTAVAQKGVHDRFRILGLVPRKDVYVLQRQALALLQPSLFEGWSTSIEEAKSLGKRVIASDLAVNIEQIADADCFVRDDAQSLADTLQKVSGEANPGPDLPREAAARAAFPGRVNEFAMKFMGVLKEAVSS